MEGSLVDDQAGIILVLLFPYIALIVIGAIVGLINELLEWYFPEGK